MPLQLTSEVGYLVVTVEKSVYYPGETVKIVGGAVTPGVTWTYVDKRGKGLGVTVSISDPSGMIIHEGESDPALSPYKEYIYFYKLPDNATQGHYVIQVRSSLFELNGKGYFDVRTRTFFSEFAYEWIFLIVGVLSIAILILRRHQRASRPGSHDQNLISRAWVPGSLPALMVWSSDLLAKIATQLNSLSRLCRALPTAFFPHDFRTLGDGNS